jgi:hypothetical protein
MAFMRRYALLIESSQVADLQDLPGARADVALLRNWLLSPKGGAWRNDEIKTLRQPTIKLLKSHLAAASESEYAFVTFSGHGHHVIGPNTNATRICLNDSEEFSARDLVPSNPRSTLIIDACRGITVMLSTRFLEANMRKALKFSRADELKVAREKFNLLVRSCGNGSVRMYSCSVDQSAGEDENGHGGVFTLGLVRSAQRWQPDTNDHYLTVQEAFFAAATSTTNHNPQQKPRICSSRPQQSFPFAV